jgi:hypothetical protein
MWRGLTPPLSSPRTRGPMAFRSGKTEAMQSQTGGVSAYADMTKMALFPLFRRNVPNTPIPPADMMGLTPSPVATKRPSPYTIKHNPAVLKGWFRVRESEDIEVPPRLAWVSIRMLQRKS